MSLFAWTYDSFLVVSVNFDFLYFSLFNSLVFGWQIGLEMGIFKTSLGYKLTTTPHTQSYLQVIP